MAEDYQRMRWEAGLVDDVSELIGPGIAKEIEKVVERAVHLARLCSLWLSFCDDDTERASLEEPIVPYASWPHYKEFKAAYDGCGAWSRNDRPDVWPTVSVTRAGKIRKVNRGTANPRPHQRWDWEWVFNYWLSGGLERGIQAMLSALPDENAERVKKVMA